jgi:hypothetical protein
MNDELNKKIEEVLREPMEVVHARIRATKKTMYREVTIEHCVIVVEDDSFI